jgi:radical SAM protein with 4Fe4S-binding SPASM domain
MRFRILKHDDSLSSRGGLVDIERPMRKRICYQASTDAIVDYKGNVILCCNDYNISQVFGNIEDMHIEKIWNQPEFKRVRKDLRKGIFDLDLCRTCIGEK